MVYHFVETDESREAPTHFQAWWQKRDFVYVKDVVAGTIRAL